jgi:hypothetical protein
MYSKTMQLNAKTSSFMQPNAKTSSFMQLLKKVDNNEDTAIHRNGLAIP